MKHSKCPTLKQKKKLKAMRLNPENWLIIRDDLDCLQIEHRYSGQVRIREWKGETVK